MATTPKQISSRHGMPRHSSLWDKSHYIVAANHLIIEKKSWVVPRVLAILTPVIPNRDAAADKGVVRRCQGCRQILNQLSVFYCLGYLRYSLFDMLGSRQIFLVLQGAVNQKRLKNTDLDNYCWESISKRCFFFSIPCMLA